MRASAPRPGERAPADSEPDGEPEIEVPPRPRGKVLALVGPTASGKTAMALEIAPELGAEIVSCDSMLVYRGMDIGTAKPTAEERARVRHHLVDIVEPARDFTVQQFQTVARAAIDEISSRGKRPLLVGGSGLYFRAVVDALEFPGTDPKLRERLEKEASEADPREFHARLAERDPEAAARISPANVRRVVRALEVWEVTGRPFSSFRKAWDARESVYPLKVCGLSVPPEDLSRRIEDRVRRMLEAGLVEETRALAARPMSRTARQALGYKEILDHLAGHCTLEEAVALTVRRTRAFARRQLSWFRADPRVCWLPASEGATGVLEFFRGPVVEGGMQ